MIRATFLVVTLGLLLAACGDRYQQGAGIYTSPPDGRTAAAPTVAAMPAPAVQSTDPGAGESSEAGPLTRAQRRVVRAATVQVRLFLRGFLPYTYGQADAAAIRAVTPALRHELAARPPRVPANARRARPHVDAITLSGLDRARVFLLAKVRDGASRYATLLTMRRRGSRWVVSEVR